MKKLFFTVMAIAAFSLTSFGNGIENKNLATPLKMGVESELTNTTKDDFCFDVTIRWTTVTGVPNANSVDDGIIMSFHHFTFIWCW